MEEENRIHLNRTTKEKAISLIVLSIVFVTIWYMHNIVLLTFVITFTFYHLLQMVQKCSKKYFSKRAPDALVLSFLYIIFVLIVTIGIIEIVPKLTEQVLSIADLLKLFDVKKFHHSMDPRLEMLLSYVDINKYIYDAGNMIGTWVTTVGGFGVNIFLSMILSFFLLLEKNKIKRFGERLEKSKISFIYDYLVNFGGNFAKTFGKVMKVQVTIALVNSILSMILLTAFGFHQIAGLGIMIFILGLVPVAGVVISLAPLSVIAFNIGGISKVVMVVVMVIVIHTIEAYILNPKLMSHKTELPVCFVFIILLVGEHYMGVWGLLIGVPIFIFLMSALDVEYEEKSKMKEKNKMEKDERKKEKKR